MPLQATSGAASYDAFGGGVPVVPAYIEDVFNTNLRLSDGTNTQAIVNNIDLSTKGGLVWSKPRAAAGENNILVDSANGLNKYFISDASFVQGTMGFPYVFNTNGFTSGNGNFWANGVSLVDWTFRKAPKFFDVVTFTAGTNSNRRISHSLGSAPGMILLKANESRNWYVYHRSLGRGAGAFLNLTNAPFTSADTWGTSDPTSTDFGFDEVGWATSGKIQTAYIFAHDAGGFGLTGTDNVISCGTVTTNSSGSATVNLGYEPQWLLLKSTVGSANWRLFDSMRGMSLSSSRELRPNTSDAESNQGIICPPNATGFNIENIGGVDTFIYMAIRRGPMKVPTLGTTVFNAIARNGTGGTGAVITGVGFTPDLLIDTQRTKVGDDRTFAFDRLRGPLRNLVTNETAAEVSTIASVTSYDMDGITVGDSGRVNSGAATYINWFFKRAPSVFDEVCYTGTGSATTQTHNLGVVPELVIWKRRSSTSDWRVWQSSFSVNDGVYLNLSFAKDTDSTVQTAIPTATVLNLSTGAYTNASGSTYVAYLFATCAGVSKVGSYTGNGSTQTIDCGFGAGGARFVIIKRTDSTGDWYVYDTIRGMTTVTDPYLLLNSTTTETATLGSVTTVSTGFALNSTILAAINVSGGSYIFLAIA